MADVPRIYRVIFHVSDLESAISLYTDLLGTAGRRVAPQRYYFDCGGVILALIDPRSEAEGKVQPAVDDLYLAVNDLETVFARAAGLGCLAAGTVHDAPAGQIATRPWGERSFYAIDPFGNQLCFVDANTLFTGQ